MENDIFNLDCSSDFEIIGKRKGSHRGRWCSWCCCYHCKCASRAERKNVRKKVNLKHKNLINSTFSVATVLCGGNIDASTLTRVIDRGLIAEGRICRFTVTVSDRPGGMAEMLCKSKYSLHSN